MTHGSNGRRPAQRSDADRDSLLIVLAPRPHSCGACGGSTASPSAQRDPSAAPASGRCLVRGRSAAAVGGPIRRRLHRPGGDDHLLDLGRPAGDQEPAGDRRRVPRRQPEDHGQGRPCRTGTRTGTSSRPGSPAATRPTCSRWTARSSRTTRAATSCSTSSRTSTSHGYDLDPAGRPGRRRLHHARRPVRPAARPERRRALLQQEDVRRGRHPLSRRHVGLGEARRGRQEADPDQRRRQGQPVGLLHRDVRHGELLVVPGLAERRRHHLGRPQDQPRRQRPGRRRPSSSSRT